MAGTSMVVAPSSIAGVDVLVPGTAEFEGALTRLLGGHHFDGVRDSLPYSVIVRNRTARRIVLMAVLFEVQPTPGANLKRTLKRVGNLEAFADAGVGIKAGGLWFVSLSNADGAVNGHDVAAYAGSRGSLAAAEMNNRLADSASIACSLDCILFEDGSFVGPDRGLAGKVRTYDRLMKSILGETEILAHVSSMRGNTFEEVKAYLTHQAGQGQSDPLDMYAQAVAGRARSMLRALEIAGPTGQVEMFDQSDARLRLLKSLPKITRQ
jgi:hypothetical protein